MRRINHRFLVLVILFCVYTANGYSQNLLAGCKALITTSSEQISGPQPINLNVLINFNISTRALHSSTAAVALKDGKTLSIAAQAEKKTNPFLDKYFCIISLKKLILI
ncbi:MAG: hypothetical protein ABIS69_03240 [Sediminibacterium sp.]